MAIRKILELGDATLKKVSKEVEKIDKSIISLVNDMQDTLYSTQGIGLAAPQIGVLKRVILIDLGEEDEEPIILLNPVIVAKVGEEESIEGCLSYPGYEGTLMRPKKVTVQGINLKGKKVEYVAEGLLGKAFCHEIDHLNGIMYVDLAKEVYEIEE